MLETTGRTSPFSVLTASLVLGWAAASPVEAQTARLNAHFEYPAVVGDVYDFELKANGNFLFFRSEERRAGTVELFAASTLGTTPIRRENRLLLPERSVLDYQPSPVGSWIVFLADQDADELFELYSRTVTDTAPRKLNGALADGDVTSFAIAPSGARVVYLATQGPIFAQELYSVPIDGSASPVKLSGTLVSGGRVSSFVVSPTSGRVVFRATKDALSHLELYSAKIDGSSTPVKLNLPLPTPGQVGGTPPAITSDGTTVVFTAKVTSSAFGLFRAPIDASSATVRVNSTPGSGDFVTGFRLGSDDQRVVYTAATLPGVEEVYSAPLDGSQPPIRLHPALPFDGGVRKFALAPAADRVAFVASLGLDAHGHHSYVLYSVPIDGSGAPLALDVPPDGLDFSDLVISPDSSRALYLVRDPNSAGPLSRELRSVRLDASSSAVRLDAPGGSPATSFGSNDVPFALSADSQRVIYLWHPANTTNEDVASRGLYSVSIDGSAAPVTLAEGGVSYRIAASPVGARAYFVAALAGGGVNELYGITLQGTNLVKLSGNLARDTFSDVSAPQPGAPAYTFLAGGERVLHCADATTDRAFELFTGRVDGGTRARPLESGGITGAFRASPDGTRAVYSDGDLYSVPTDASASPVKLFDGASAGEIVFDDFEVSPNGARVLFRSTALSPIAGLFSVPIAGGAAVQLEDEEVIRFELSASAGRAVFVVRDSQPDKRLFSAPMDGGEPPIQLDPSILLGDDIQLTPDGLRVVYTSALGPGIVSVPVDGSASPSVLSGSVFAFFPRVSPDGQWVVFAGQETFLNGITELFSARLDGSLGPLKLSAPMVLDGDLLTSPDGPAFFISPDSTRVVYVADQEVDGRLELYRVSIDQTTQPVKLNGPLPVGGNVLMFPGFTGVQIAPDGSRVVYVADQEVDHRFELYSAPLGFSSSPTKLNGALVFGGGLATSSGAPFVISPDSRLVVYRADQVLEGLFDLFLVPIDRSLEPLALTGALARPGVTFPAITPDSRRVVYQATERSQVTELFSAVLTFDPFRRHLANGGAERP